MFIDSIFKKKSYIPFNLKKFLNLLILGCAGSSLLLGPLSSCGEQGLLSPYGALASHWGASPVAEHRL